MTRRVMWLLLAVVAAAAAVLSFASLRQLAEVCGFTPSLSWLLPIVIDAGAASGATIWLTAGASKRAQGYARALTLALLVASVTGNAVVHYLTAYALHPAWELVVAVSAVAPAVLGAVVHLSVLVGRAEVPIAETAIRPARKAAAAPAKKSRADKPPPQTGAERARRHRAKKRLEAAAAAA